jgi:DNA/RNA-binding domain of Phe-tRNA-synthetase-like protein
LQGKGLYRISNVVDVINLVSISTGYSIGGYDQGRIHGEVELGIGKEGEPYEGLGRGVLNIHKMPVFRDDEGAFGSPTSDSERTNVRPDTQRFLMVFLDFGGDDQARTQAVELAEGYLSRFCGGSAFEHWEV